jgi:hypothetical protein
MGAAYNLCSNGTGELPVNLKIDNCPREADYATRDC